MRGVFLCDGVGLGKTFVGLMLIERLIMHERKRVALFAPKTALEDVWKPAIRRYLRHVGSGDYSSLARSLVLTPTLAAAEAKRPTRLERVLLNLLDAVVIDEAHHFRNPGAVGDGESRPSRYRQLFDLVDGPRGKKELFLLTATPINNRLHDFRFMAELFTRRQDDYFARSLGVHSLRGHFVKMEKELLAATHQTDPNAETNLAEAEQILTTDTLFKNLVVQRSRAYVRQSQLQQGGSVAMFPERETPRVADYSVKRTYGRLLEMVEAAFQKNDPLFMLGIYYPLAYFRGDDGQVDPWEANRQKQVCALIRTQFLKRFESSASAFEQSCNRLLIKLLTWVTCNSTSDAEKRRLERWKQQHGKLIGFVRDRQLELFPDDADEDVDEEELVTQEMIEDIDPLDREKYNVEDILADTYLDLDELAKFLDELQKFEVKHDDKLKALLKLLRSDPVLKRHKALIFTEFADTARYLKAQLTDAGVEGIEQIDGGSKNRRQIIRRFAPYYNGSSSAELAAKQLAEIRILISTDVLSEGLNLQDATRLINYDLHWNPVRLMQRIGRVDRRMNPEIEQALVADHPDVAEERGKIVYWNFLPPSELEILLNLYGRVSHKTLRISKVLGIEGSQLLRPDDTYAPPERLESRHRRRADI